MKLMKQKIGSLTEVVSSSLPGLGCLECLDHLGGHLVLLPHQVPGHAVLLVPGPSEGDDSDLPSVEQKGRPWKLPSAWQKGRLRVMSRLHLGQVLGELLEEVVGDDERLGCWSAIIAQLWMVRLAGWLSSHS